MDYPYKHGNIRGRHSCRRAGHHHAPAGLPFLSMGIAAALTISLCVSLRTRMKHR